MDRGLLLGGQPRRPSHGGVAVADPNSSGSPLLLRLRARLDIEQPNSA